jgi:hypothetical protein
MVIPRSPSEPRTQPPVILAITGSITTPPINWVAQSQQSQVKSASSPDFVVLIWLERWFSLIMRAGLSSKFIDIAGSCSGYSAHPMAIGAAKQRGQQN